MVKRNIQPISSNRPPYSLDFKLTLTKIDNNCERLVDTNIFIYLGKKYQP